MPSALETLVKILKLEREQGCKNSAVIGGLGSFSEKWSQDAHGQARKPEHHLLVDELVDRLQSYEAIDNRSERQNSINYMLDRIMGRIPPPPELLAKLAALHPPPEPQSSPPVELPAATETPPDVRTKPAEEPPQSAPERGKRPDRPKRSPRPEGEENRPAASSQPNRPQPPSQQRDNRPAASRPSQQKPSRGSFADSHDDDDGDSGEVERFDGDGMGYDNYDAPSRSRGKGRGREVVELDLPAPPRLTRVPRRPRPSRSPEEAEDLLNGLRQSVTTIKGVGQGTAKLLERLGIVTLGQLLDYHPRRYDDYTRMRTIAQLTPDPDVDVTVIGTVMHAEIRIGRGNRKDFFIIIDDGTARMGVTFFGRHFMIRQVRKGQQLVLSGPVTMFRDQAQMIGPEWEPLEVDHLNTVGIVPVYSLTEGLSQRTLRKLMKNAIEYWSERLPDYVPETTLERSELADLGWAIKQIHFPESWDHLQHARSRFVFDQLLLLQLTMLGYRREWQSVPAVPLEVNPEQLESLIQSLFPYPLTGAQRRAIDDIRRDVQSSRPMNRLVQGDVGSGKTAVAIVAITMALVQGKQAALMVPTSILAEQHYRSVSATLAKMPVERPPVVALLTGSLSTSERQSIYRGMADGSIDVVIGTHALIQEGVEFKDLALAIVDEQHRFGVEQRKALRGKGTNPHLLVMTATPIPRTLALTIHADLDLSIIDEMPPGRIPIQTKVIQPVERERVYKFIEAQMNQGRQAFVVHPLVEASEKIEAPAAVEAYERLKQVFFRHRVGLLHGRMRPAEKDDVMAAFSSGAFDVLVTTSVAEVGVNVPNATVMVIEGANRFGLAQLHQFRGRVGRGEHASYCLLLSDTSTDEANQRLQVMEDTNDGFRLAEMDWKLRGAGDLVGTRQSGGSRLQLAELMTPEFVALAQREARTIYEEDPVLSQPGHRLLAQRVTMLRDERSDVS